MNFHTSLSRLVINVSMLSLPLKVRAIFIIYTRGENQHANRETDTDHPASDLTADIDVANAGLAIGNTCFTISLLISLCLSGVKAPRS